MLITHPAFVLKSLYPSLVWNIETEEKELFLTFDDGPTAGVTDPLLDLLQKFNAKATFFCLGKNIEENPDLFKRLIDEGHTVGNHSYDHINGWKSTNIAYLRNVMRFQDVYAAKYFRPPYGRLKPAQINSLKHEFEIIMWSALSMDYDSSQSKEDCFNHANAKIKSGDILLFHDSLKAKDRMFYAVERTLEERSDEGYRFSALSN